MDKIIDKIINHKYFKYLKIFGLFIILLEVLKTGSVFMEYMRFVGTEEEWRFFLVSISLIIKSSLFLSLLLVSVFYPIYESLKKWL